MFFFAEDPNKTTADSTITLVLDGNTVKFGELESESCAYGTTLPKLKVRMMAFELWTS